MEARAQPQDVRERIVAHATRLFAERGFDGVSLQSIADAVGIRKPSLLYHFESKDALRVEVMERMLAHWRAEMPRILTAAQTGKNRFKNGMGALVSFFADSPDRARLMVREMLDQPDQIRTLLSEHFQPWTRMVTDYIRMGQQAGSVRADVDADSWVAQVVTMVIGTAACGDVTSALVSEPGGTSVSLKQQIDELVRIAGRSLFNVRPDAGQEPEDG